MIRPFASLLLALCALAFIVPAFGEEKLKDGREIDIPKSKLPEKISKAALEAVPGGKIADIDRDIKDGKITWDLGVDLNGKEFNVKVDEEGKLISKVEVTAEKLKVADLPAAISDGVKKEFPAGKITTAEKLTKAGVVTYEMDVDVAKKTYEVVFDADGKLLTKAEASEDEGKEKEKK
jgi:uncharacterized membrane protein YkoI